MARVLPGPVHVRVDHVRQHRPDGLAVSGNTVYMAEAGPVPHNPEDGKVVSFAPNKPIAAEVASGARLLVDVEFGRGRKLYALSRSVWDDVEKGTPRCQTQARS
jgi:hypothetical protein